MNVSGDQPRVTTLYLGTSAFLSLLPIIPLGIKDGTCHCSWVNPFLHVWLKVPFSN